MKLYDSIVEIKEKQFKSGIRESLTIRGGEEFWSEVKDLFAIFHGRRIPKSFKEVVFMGVILKKDLRFK